MARYAGEPKSNFFRVSHMITESKEFKGLNQISQILYFTLCRLRNRLDRGLGTFFRSDRQLENDSGLSRPTVTKAKQDLKQKGFIDFVSKKGRRCRYHIWEKDDVLTGV
jgi:DNA-binding GntR family transcriptional regulator